LGRKFITVIAMAALSVGLAAAQGTGPGKKDDKRSKDAPPVHAPRFASPGRPQGPVSRGPGPHMGDWFRRNETLPPDQQLRKLEQNPDFQHLPPDRQQRLRERLQNFISLPPEQKDRILHRMETYERLAPEQQQRVHDLFRQYRGLPPDRRQELKRGFQQLEGMTPDERQKMLDSPEYRNNFSDQERGLLRGMSTIGITPGQPGPPPPR
jgi:Spy/CpxP family protein refolding chaperone